MKPEKPPDILKFAQILNDEGVDWVLVGGMAMVLHGSAYVTVDTDLAIAFESKEDGSFAAALKRLRAHPARWGSAESFEYDAKLLSVPFLEFASDCGPFHLLSRLPGIKTYAELRARAKVLRIDGVEIIVASLEDLKSMKSASSRPKDRLHLAEIQELRKLNPED